mgnify:CR=1 FL=1
MKEFEFESQFHGDMVPHIIFGDQEKPFCQVRLRTGLCNVHFDEHRKSDCIRALLSLNTEREKIFAEAIESFNEFADRIGGNDAVEAQIKSLAARWHATTGDATGAEGQR